MNPSIAKKFCKIGYAYMDIKSADKPDKSADKSNKSADKHSKSAARQAAYFIHNISNDL